jgi:hypothetical protein
MLLRNISWAFSKDTTHRLACAPERESNCRQDARSFKGPESVGAPCLERSFIASNLEVLGLAFTADLGINSKLAWDN